MPSSVPSAKHPESLLVVKLGAIGDVVNSLPLLCRLRAGLSKTRITWLIAPLAHALVEGHDAVDEFLVFDIKQRRSWPALWRQLRDGRFDTVLALQRILKSAALSRASAVPRDASDSTERAARRVRGSSARNLSRPTPRPA